MINDLFSIPLYCKEDAFLTSEIDQINKCFYNLKEREQLTTFNGTAELSFSTPLKSVLDEYKLYYIKEKIKFYCKLYIKSIHHTIKEIKITDNWVIGYSKNDYQGEHSHGNNDFSISGIIYTKVPLKSSSIQFYTPNPYSTHMCAVNTHCITFQPLEGMLLLFPSFLRHSVLPNKELQDNDLRICLAFNAMVSPT
jgi:hypothetical protein